MLLVIFVNVETVGDKHRDEAGGGVDQSSNAIVRGSLQPQRDSTKPEGYTGNH